MKKIFLLIMLVTLILLVSCNEPEIQNNETNITNQTNETQYAYFFGGQAVTFEAQSTNITLNDEIVIASSNYTGEIYLLNFCNVPFNLLKKQEVGWKYVYPDFLECADPTNITFTPGMATLVQSIQVKEGNELTPGTYMARIYYSTFGPMQYLREHNIVIDIKQ